MATDISASQEAIGPVHIIYSQPTTPTRWIERTTECRHMESLFLLVDDARDAHIRQLMDTFPHLKNKGRVVRYANLKMDQYYPQSSTDKPDEWGYVRNRPNFRDLFRVETRFTHIGNTSVKFEHRFITVPKSQELRDFNDREQDKKYAFLEEGDEPERVFASAEGGLVFIKWQTDEKGRRFFKPTQGIFQDKSLAAPGTIEFLNAQPPAKRSADSQRPANAFRVPIHLRKSDEDELGHVTNSRYVSLLHDVLTYGLRTGYYANGRGSLKTATDLPRIVSIEADPSAEVAVRAGSTFYKKGDVMEFYVGYERELKVKPGVYVWSWIEHERINDDYDVIRFEICSTESGSEEVVSLARAIIREDPRKSASL
ncbi:hypothetical protein FBU30_005807 [Linnemannia zychae]|nr:hypothetical protein FBU30_005807 [Linnemannia zychae]